MVTPAVVIGKEVRPIASMEYDLDKSRALPWTNFCTGEPVRLDWNGSGLSGTIPILSLAQYVERYASHPESKAAAPDGTPANSSTRGLLGRLHFHAADTSLVGKEINRLDEDDGVSIEDVEPIQLRLS